MNKPSPNPQGPPERRPPRWADRLLSWLTPTNLLEELQGDLQEQFAQRVDQVGPWRARWWYGLEALKVIRPYYLRRRLASLANGLRDFFPERPATTRPFFTPEHPSPPLINPDMIRNYLKIAWRNLWKNKSSSFINIFGLTIGLSCCLLIGLYILHELNFDAFQQKGNRIARVIMQYSFDGNPETRTGNFTSTKVAPVFKRTFPEVESAVRMRQTAMIINHKKSLIKEPNFMFSDSSFLDVFTAKMILGNPKKVLNGPGKVVLTESMAKKYFGAEDPLGKIIQIATDSTIYEVTGVMEDYPAGSQFRIDFLASLSSLHQNQEATYWNVNYTTYLLLKDERSFETLQAKIRPFMKNEMAGQGASIYFFLEHFNRVHLSSEYDSFVPNTNIAYLYMLSAVALLILTIVCFTYINLSTARSMERAREVGVRKVIGAGSGQLFWQFVGESGITCMIAVFLSIGIITLLLPDFNQLTERQLSVKTLFAPESLVFLVLFTFIVGLLAGSYPAVVLAGFQPIKVLKGAFRNTGSGKRIQQSLIVVQFSIAIFLIISTLIIQNQLWYIQNKKLGYNREKVLVVPINNRVMDDISLIKQEFKVTRDIVSVSRCSSSPVNIVSGYVMRSATMPDNEKISVNANPIDEDYVKTTGLQIVAGEDFTIQDIKDVSPQEQRDRNYHFILNESAAKQLGWTPQEAVGKKMYLDNSRPGFVKAVVKDFHFESMHQVIKPLVLFPEIRGKELLIKTTGNDLAGTIEFLETKWKQLIPYMPFEYRFLDDDYTKLYRSEHQLGKIMSFFTSLSILLACLGLFGLTSYIVQQRTKEIGIRKVLGASISGIMILISSGFVRLVAIAFVISFPLAWWAMGVWLNDFVYRITIGWQVFAIAGVSVLVITLLTVGFQAVQAALMNPVKSLRSE
jgi:putative ABC transport system permease protein